MAKKTYVAAFDGAPGIMPGIMTFETLVEFEDDEPTSAPRIKEEFQVRRGKPIPMHKRRMMPCNKKKQERLVFISISKRNLSIRRFRFF